MAQSLVKLTLESNQYERGIKQAQRSWKEFTDGIGLSISKFTAVGAAIGAVTGALKVAKDAFFKNEQQLDEWNRTVEASKSVYNGFLNALNNGDISGFLSNINNITEAARAAYDALDELGTFNAFNQIQTQKARTGFTEAMAGYRMGEGSKENVQKAAKAYQEELRTRMEKEREAYSQAVRKIAAERGVPWGNLEQALTGKYGSYEALKKTMPSGTQTKFLPGGQFGGATTIQVPLAVTAQEKMGEALRSLNDTELKELQALGAQAERTAEEIAQIDKQMARVLNGRQSGGTINGGGKTTIAPTFAADSIAAQQKLVQDLTKQWNEAGASVRDQYIQPLVEAEEKLKQMKNEQALLKEQAQGRLNGVNLWQGDIDDIAGGPGKRPQFAGGIPEIGKGLDTLPQFMSPLQQMNSELSRMRELLELAPDTSAYQSALQAIIEKEKEIARFKNGTDTEDVAKGSADAWRGTAAAMSSVSSAMSQMEDPSARIMGIIGEAIANIAVGFATASAKEGKGGIWYWIAATAAGLATMISTISAIHSATGFAQGGMVQGNTYSGDQVPIRANAGEVVLTRAMQGNLASQLEGNGLGNLNLSATISGEQIRLALNNNGRRTGRGEYVQTNFR